VEAELEAARVESSRSRTKLGSYKGTLEASAFTLANPGGGANLLEDAACTLERGRRYGLIGRNGKGKSTMLRALAARRVGAVPPNVVVHYVSQEVQLTEATRHLTPAQVVVAGDIERRLLLEECAELEALADEEQLDSQGQERLGEVYEGLENIESDTAERRADELLINLGFSDALRARPLEALSGGWRVRTMLACAVFARPDLLLLDEPTNHLSITAVMWLARELSTSPIWKERIVVVVSHDRAFLDEVCGDVLHISGAARRLTQSHGNYSTWSKRRSEQQATYAKEALLREKEVERMKEFAGHGFKYGGSSSAINKMKMLDKQASKLEVEAADQALELAALQEDMELPLSLKSGGLLPGFVVQLKDVGFGYPGAELLFTGAEFGLTSQSRVVLLGENGNGKTTLVKLMLGELLPTSGEVLIKSGCRVALVNQHHADQIDLSLSPLQYMMQLYKAPEGTSAFDHLQSLRSHLAGCGVTGGSGSTAPVQGAVGEAPSLNLQTTPCAALSGGQRSRVALAAVSFREPHLLVLDEPTNNLDLESVAALAESVRNFQGAVVCVSHDQFFVNAIATEAWVVGGASKQVRRVESFAAYRAVQLKRLLSNAQAAAVSGTNSSSISSSSSSSSKSKASAAGPKPKRVQATTTKPKGQGPAKSTSRDAF
jgi:ATP-binding cassette subfamily F protein 3